MTNIKFYFLTAVIIILITAPFWHKFFPKTSTIEFLGFKNKRVFLYSFGSHLSSFSISLFLLFIAKLVTSPYRKLVHLVALMFMGISFYFTFWTIAPITDYPRIFYEVAIILSSLIAAFIVSLLVSINIRLRSDYINHHKENTEFIKLANDFIDEYKSKYEEVG